MATTRAQTAVNRAERARDSVATATPPLPAREPGVNTRSERPGDAAFLDGSVQFMASSPRVEFSTELGAEVPAKASALLVSVRMTSLHPAELHSVRKAWSAVDHSSWKGQLKAAPTLPLVKALRMAHDGCHDTVL